MFLWMLIIILLTVSMIMTYYLIPDGQEVLMVHAYAILLISLGIMYRVYRKMKARRTESLIEELNFLRMRVAQLEGEVLTDEDLEDQEDEL